MSSQSRAEVQFSSEMRMMKYKTGIVSVDRTQCQRHPTAENFIHSRNSERGRHAPQRKYKRENREDFAVNAERKKS